MVPIQVTRAEESIVVREREEEVQSLFSILCTYYCLDLENISSVLSFIDIILYLTCNIYNGDTFLFTSVYIFNDCDAV